MTAACKDADPRMFDNTATVPTLIAAARMFCAGCPVRVACEEQARRDGATGLWGGWRFPDQGRPHRYYDLPLSTARDRRGERPAGRVA